MGEPVKYSDFQEVTLDRIMTCDFLNAPVPVPLLREDQKDLLTEIDAAIKGIGIVILVGMPGVRNLEPDKDPANCEFSFEIAIAEDTLLNRDVNNSQATNIPAGDVAMALFQRLHGFKPFPWGRFRVEKSDPIRDDKKQIHHMIVKSDRILPPI